MSRMAVPLRYPTIMLFLCLAISVCAIRVMANPGRFDVFHPEHSTSHKSDETAS